MKPRAKKPDPHRKTSMMVSAEVNAEFRSLCEAKMLKPHLVHQEIILSWIAKEKKKQNFSLAVNG